MACMLVFSCKDKDKDFDLAKLEVKKKIDNLCGTWEIKDLQVRDYEFGRSDDCTGNIVIEKKKGKEYNLFATSTINGEVDVCDIDLLRLREGAEGWVDLVFKRAEEWDDLVFVDGVDFEGKLFIDIGLKVPFNGSTTRRKVTFRVIGFRYDGRTINTNVVVGSRYGSSYEPRGTGNLNLVKIGQ